MDTWRDPRSLAELAARKRELELAALRSAVEALERSPPEMPDRQASLTRALRSLVNAIHRE